MLLTNTACFVRDALVASFAGQKPWLGLTCPEVDCGPMVRAGIWPGPGSSAMPSFAAISQSLIGALLLGFLI